MKDKIWSVCKSCLGRGTKSKKLSKKARSIQRQVNGVNFSSSNLSLERPKGHLVPCVNCEGAGIIYDESFQIINSNHFPHVAIVGAGIAGVALAVACQHRGIPFTLYERDLHFNDRKQGYGLTLQQASRSLKGLGIRELKDGVISTRHIVHTISGQIIGEWGTRKWCEGNINRFPKRSNIHISRQSLRQELFDQLDGKSNIKWGHQFVNFSKSSDSRLRIDFLVEGREVSSQADLLVGADGIRSLVRRELFGDSIKPLHYLNCIVILGICSLSDIVDTESSLLDGSTVFQTANGNERIFVMPFTKDSIMWQLSFPMEENDAKQLSVQGAQALKNEAMMRINWHNPIPQIITATPIDLISGYPVYDRDLLSNELDVANQSITLIGDAAHPMSPFKGQGANQAILDALSLARTIYIKYQYTPWGKTDLREDILCEFEKEMLGRSNIKVKESAEAANFLHSDSFFEGGDQPRRQHRG